MGDKIFDVNNSDEMLQAFEKLSKAMEKMDASGSDLDKTLKDIYKDYSNINKAVDKYNKTPIGKKFKQQSREMQSNARGFSSSNAKNASRMTQDLTSLFNSLGNSKTRTAVNGLSKGLSILGAESAAVAASVTLGAAALSAFGVAAGKAYKANLQLNNSLRSIGDTANELTSATSDSSNKFIAAKNNFKTAFNELGSSLEGLVDIAAEAVDTLAKGIKTVSGADSNYNYNTSNSKVRWYTSKLANYGVSEYNSVPQIASTAASAKQSGFSNTSAANLAIGTYDMAIKKAVEYGKESQEVAETLAQAWLNGSDAAKEYGVVVDDQTLTGYMYSKGIDIANVKITDAMKQYYRYQLMQEELNSDSSDAMQDQIKSWKQLGMQIDLAKNKLFSFDEVINLVAVDTTIPEVGTPNVSFESLAPDGTVPNPVNPNPNPRPNPRPNPENLDENTNSENENTNAVDENTEALNDNSEARNANTEAITGNTLAIDENTDAINNNNNALVTLNVTIQQIYDEITGGQPALEAARDAVDSLNNGIVSLNTNFQTLFTTFQVFIQLLVQGRASVEQFSAAMATLSQMANLLNINFTQLIATETALNNVVAQSVLQFMQLAMSVNASSSAIDDFVDALEDKISTLKNSQSANQNEINSLRSIASAARSAAQAYRELASAKASASGSTISVGSTRVGGNKASRVNIGSIASVLPGATAKAGVGAVVGTANDMSFGLLNGISNAISNAKNKGSVIKGLLSGVADFATGKATLGSVSVNNNMQASFGKPDLLEVLDLADSIIQSGDVAGSIGSFAVNSITALPTTVANNYDTFKGNGDSTAKALAKSIASAGVWAFEEELDDIATAGMYIGAATGKLDESDAIGKRRLELALAFQQQGWWDDKIAKAVNGAATVEQLESMYSLFSAERPKYNSNSEMLNYYGLATGGIGVKETTATLFENNKKEAVIPLETQSGIDFMANALNQALNVNNNSRGGSNNTINMTFSDIVMLNDEQSLDRLAEKITPALKRYNDRIGG